MIQKKIRSEVSKLTDQIVRNYHPEKIILFGSAVSGRMHEWSDIDFVVVKKTSKRFYDRIGEVSLMVDHILPIDFIVYTPEEFERMSKDSYFVRDEILAKGKVLYER